MEISSFDTISQVMTLPLAAVLAWASAIDLRSYRLPDFLILPLIPAGLAIASLKGWPLDQALGAAIGYAVFYLIGEVYFRLRGVDGLGQGDAKLLAAAGAWLGATALPVVILLAAVPALVVSVISKQRRLAFGPYLSAAFLAVWIWRVI